MSKYANVVSDIEGLFATSAWTTNNISTYPSNYEIPSTDNEFIKIEVLPLNTNSGYSRAGVQGLIIIQVYVTANKGIRRLMEIADLLDSLLQNKTLSNGTKTESSSISILGQDRDNPNLFRGDYTVNFKFFN